MKMFKSLLPISLLFVLSMNAYAGWQLKADDSSVHFISVKKEHVAETHHFKHIEGSINDAGNFSIKIDLASVETGIDIRNQRMQNMLFDVANFKHAEISADLSALLASKLKKGKPTQFNTKQAAKLSLHGQSKQITIELLVSYDGKSQLTASVTKPILIKAKDFGLEEGIAALQKIAGLPGITKTVPVSANLVFIK